MSSHFISSHYGPSHYEPSHYGREVVIELPDVDVHPPGMGRQQIIKEDEEIMAIIVSFLSMKGH
jgi:hypothetical protein